jgi:hypothetical protein
MSAVFLTDPHGGLVIARLLASKRERMQFFGHLRVRLKAQRVAHEPYDLHSRIVAYSFPQVKRKEH